MTGSDDKNSETFSERSPLVHAMKLGLAALPPRVPPQELTMQLRVMASRQAERRRSARTLRQRFNLWRGDFKLWTDNLMRPLAIPTAGGFASAAVLFSVFASGITIPSVSASAPSDVPTGLYTEASVKTYLPLAFDGSDLVVELTIDDQGRVVDFSLPNCPYLKPELRRNLGTRLLFTQFTPATTFGQPTGGKVRLWFRSSRIEVRG